MGTEVYRKVEAQSEVKLEVEVHSTMTTNYIDVALSHVQH